MYRPWFVTVLANFSIRPICGAYIEGTKIVCIRSKSAHRSYMYSWENQEEAFIDTQTCKKRMKKRAKNNMQGA